MTLTEQEPGLLGKTGQVQKVCLCTVEHDSILELLVDMVVVVVVVELVSIFINVYVVVAELVPVCFPDAQFHFVVSIADCTVKNPRLVSHGLCSHVSLPHAPMDQCGYDLASILPQYTEKTGNNIGLDLLAGLFQLRPHAVGFGILAICL